MLASACPGWVCYAEKTHGTAVLPNISTAKSPQAVSGHLFAFISCHCCLPFWSPVLACAGQSTPVCVSISDTPLSGWAGLDGIDTPLTALRRCCAGDGDAGEACGVQPAGPGPG